MKEEIFVLFKFHHAFENSKIKGNRFQETVPRQIKRFGRWRNNRAWIHIDSGEKKFSDHGGKNSVIEDRKFGDHEGQIQDRKFKDHCGKKFGTAGDYKGSNDFGKAKVSLMMKINILVFCFVIR